jgi:saccharopine dehydrogenase-like NADP-dependent oxidoreductase
MTTKLILLGAGKIGDAILNLLSHADSYQITVADQDEKRLNYIDKLALPNTQCVTSNLTDINTVTEIIRGHEITVSAAPYFLTPTIASAAKKAHSHYFDLTEDVASTRVV